jgi:ATP-dependent Lon protease
MGRPASLSRDRIEAAAAQIVEAEGADVWYVQGFKEKVLAAKRAGLKEIILCWQNEKDVNEINAEFIKGMKFHYVKTMQQVLELALV